MVTVCEYYIRRPASEVVATCVAPFTEADLSSLGHHEGRFWIKTKETIQLLLSPSSLGHYFLKSSGSFRVRPSDPTSYYPCGLGGLTSLLQVSVSSNGNNHNSIYPHWILMRSQLVNTCGVLSAGLAIWQELNKSLLLFSLIIITS